MAFGAQREIELRILVVVRKIGIEIRLAVPFGEVRNAAVERHPGHHRQLDRPFVHDRDRPGHREDDLIDERVRRSVEIVGMSAVGDGAEHLAAGGELDVDFHADEDFVFDGRGGLGHWIHQLDTNRYKENRLT